MGKTGFVLLGQVLASKRFHLANFAFSGLRPFWSSQVFKSGYIFSSKSFGKFSSGFFVKFVCLGKVHFSQSQFLSIGFGKSSALAFFQFYLGFNGKVGLVKNDGACKIKSQKLGFGF